MPPPSARTSSSTTAGHGSPRTRSRASSSSPTPCPAVAERWTTTRWTRGTVEAATPAPGKRCRLLHDVEDVSAGTGQKALGAGPQMPAPQRLRLLVRADLDQLCQALVGP